MREVIKVRLGQNSLDFPQSLSSKIKKKRKSLPSSTHVHCFIQNSSESCVKPVNFPAKMWGACEPLPLAEMLSGTCNYLFSLLQLASDWLTAMTFQHYSSLLLFWLIGFPSFLIFKKIILWQFISLQWVVIILIPYPFVPSYSVSLFGLFLSNIYFFKK